MCRTSVVRVGLECAEHLSVVCGTRSYINPPVSLTDSLLVSTGQTRFGEYFCDHFIWNDLTLSLNSMDIASEVTEEEVNMDDNYGGVDALAKAIQHSVCVYVCVRACMHACMCV